MPGLCQIYFISCTCVYCSKIDSLSGRCGCISGCFLYLRCVRSRPVRLKCFGCKYLNACIQSFSLLLYMSDAVLMFSISIVTFLVCNVIYFIFFSIYVRCLEEAEYVFRGGFLPLGMDTPRPDLLM